MERTTHDALYIQGLRDFADFLEDRPDLPVPVSGELFCVFPKLEDLSGIARMMGSVKKQVLGDSYFTLTREFGCGKYQATWERKQVCKRVVTGVREVPAQLIPATLVPAHTVEEIRWECPEALLERPGLPSGDDLDAVEAERVVQEAGSDA